MWKNEGDDEMINETMSNDYDNKNELLMIKREITRVWWWWLKKMDDYDNDLACGTR